MSDEDVPKGVAAANARTAALRDSTPFLGAQPKGDAPPTSAPPPEPSPGEKTTETERPPVRFVSVVPQDAKDTPAAPSGGAPQPSDDVARLTQEIAELRTKLEQREPSEPPPAPINLEDQLGKTASGDSDIRSLATEFNENVEALKAIVECDDATGEPLIVKGLPVAGPLRDDLNELQSVEKALKDKVGIGGFELDEDQLATLKDQRRDLKERIAERKDAVRSLANRNRLLTRGYNQRLGELRDELQRERDAKDREATEQEREAEGLTVWNDTLPALLEPYGITEKSHPREFAKASQNLAIRLEAIQTERGDDFPDLAKAMKDEFEESIAPLLSLGSGRADAAAARQKAGDTTQRAPSGSAANADLKVASDLSPRERRLAASRRTSILTRDVRANR